MPDAKRCGDGGVVPIHYAAAVQRQRAALDAQAVPVEIARLDRIDELEAALVAPKRRVIRQPRIRPNRKRDLRHSAHGYVRAERDENANHFAFDIGNAVGGGRGDSDSGRLGRVRRGDGYAKLQRSAVGRGIRSRQRISRGRGRRAVGRSRYGSGSGVERQSARRRGTQAVGERAFVVAIGGRERVRRRQADDVVEMRDGRAVERGRGGVRSAQRRSGRKRPAAARKRRREDGEADERKRGEPCESVGSGVHVLS